MAVPAPVLRELQQRFKVSGAAADGWEVTFQEPANRAGVVQWGSGCVYAGHTLCPAKLGQGSKWGQEACTIPLVHTDESSVIQTDTSSDSPIACGTGERGLLATPFTSK